MMRDTGHRVDSVQRCAHRGTVRELQEELIYPADPEEGTVRPDTGQGPFLKAGNIEEGSRGNATPLRASPKHSLKTHSLTPDVWTPNSRLLIG